MTLDPFRTITTALENGVISAEEATDIEAAFVEDGEVISDEGREALVRLREARFEGDDPNQRQAMELLARCRTTSQYFNALKLFGQNPLSTAGQARSNFLTGLDVSCESRQGDDLCPNGIDVSGDGFLTDLDVVRMGRGDLNRTELASQALDILLYGGRFSALSASDDRWQNVARLIREYVMAGDEEEVRNLLTRIEMHSPAHLDAILLAMNIHIDVDVDPSGPLYKMARIEAPIAREQAWLEMRQKVDLWQDDDFSIPLIIRNADKDDEEGLLGITEKPYPSITARKSSAFINRIDDLKRFQTTVTHELRHAIFAQFTDGDIHQPIVGEALANFFNGSDLKQFRDSVISLNDGIDEAYISRMTAELAVAPEAEVEGEHVKGDLLFFFLANRFGENGLKWFIKNLCFGEEDPVQRLDRAAREMTDGQYDWQGVVRVFGEESLTFVEKIKGTYGGDEFRLILSEIFGEDFEKELQGHGRARSVVTLDEGRREQFRALLEQFIENQSTSPYAAHAGYYLGQLDMIEGDFESARHWLWQVDQLHQVPASYAMVLSYVMEDDLPGALQVVDCYLEQSPNNKTLQKMREDLVHADGARLRQRYFDYYQDPSLSSKEYYL